MKHPGKHSTQFEKLCAAAQAAIEELSIEQLLEDQAKGSSPLILDIREDHEWDKGHIPNAQHLGRGILERDIETIAPDKDAPLILYCGGGYRSALAAESLKKMGYQRPLSLAGGWRRWCDLKQPTVIPAT